MVPLRTHSYAVEREIPRSSAVCSTVNVRNRGDIDVSVESDAVLLGVAWAVMPATLDQ